MKISKSIKIKLFREMLRIRLIEQTIASKYHEAEMRCPVHLSVGQEAVAEPNTFFLRSRYHFNRWYFDIMIQFSDSRYKQKGSQVIRLNSA